MKQMVTEVDRRAPLAVTALLTTLAGPFCAVALVWLWPLPDLGRDDLPTAALVVLEPLMYAFMLLTGASLVGAASATASLFRHEPRTKMAATTLVVNALLLGTVVVQVWKWTIVGM